MEIEAKTSMGERIKARCHELQMRPSELAARVIERAESLGMSPPQRGSIYQTIARKSTSSEWSDLIAEALDVNHRWLQCGLGPKIRTLQEWPFPDIDPVKVSKLRRLDRLQLQRAILITAMFFSIDVAAAVLVVDCICALMGHGDVGFILPAVAQALPAVTPDWQTIFVPTDTIPVPQVFSDR